MRKYLIEDWFPINEVSVESIRERSQSSALPPLYFLHVWFARKPLTTAGASILTSLLDKPDRKKIFNLLGIPSDIDLLAVQRIAQQSKSAGIKLKINPYSWDRAFKHVPTKEELSWLQNQLQTLYENKLPVILDPMAGGGSIPYEAVRLGLPTVAGDLNPVAFVLLKATVEYPFLYREKLIPLIEKFCKDIHQEARNELEQFFPKEENQKTFAYFWSRTIVCSNCNLVIPMSPNWWIVREGKDTDIAVKLILPNIDKGNTNNTCGFEIIENPKGSGYDPDEEGTDIGKDARCPRCQTKTDGDRVKKIAQSGEMDHQLYCICIKKYVSAKRLKRHFRLPTKEDIDAYDKSIQQLNIKLTKWRKQDIVPMTAIKEGLKMNEPLNFGMNKWIDMFNPRQLLTHLTYLEKFLYFKNKLLNDESIKDKELVKAVIVYGALVFDTCIDYNCLLSRWDSTRSKIANAMSMQAFPFKTNYAEFDHSEMLWPWSLTKALEAIKEIVNMLPSLGSMSNIDNKINEGSKTITIYNSDASNIPLDDSSVDAIVVDPPYHNNVMYGEVSDFFYIWLKKTIGDFFPRSFTPELTNKIDEAVANTSLYRDTSKPTDMANRHYNAKMLASFKEMKRVLKDDGILTVMFTHRKVEAWSELTKALSDAGFTFRASWPVFTEPSDKFGKTDKGNVKITILLSCRERPPQSKKGLWNEVQRELAIEAEKRVEEYSTHGITGMNLLVSTYGPVLGKYTDYNLIKDIYGNIIGPEQALDIVLEEVNKFNTKEVHPGTDLDTRSYINLLKNFPQLSIDEDLARVTTVFGGRKNIQDLDIKGGLGLIEKKGGKVTILLSKDRMESGHLEINKPEKLKNLIDIVQASLLIYEKRGIQAVKDLLEKTGRNHTDSGFLSILKIISNLGLVASNKRLGEETSKARLLLESLGYYPEVTLEKNERLDSFT